MPTATFRRSIAVARRRMGILGRKAAMATVLLESTPKVTQTLERLVGRPSLYELRQGGHFVNSAHDALLNIQGFDDHDWDRVEAEFTSVEIRLKERVASVHLAYPNTFAVERETSLLLYCMTRMLRPQCIVETGVADGASSFVFLEALRTNGSGRLHSLDVSNDVGVLVDDRDGWDLTVSSPQHVEDALASIIARVAPVDLFFHDSDHRFLPQLFEYETIAPHAASGAMLLSDDVDLSYAFSEFCQRRRARPSFLFDSRKVAGLIRL